MVNETSHRFKGVYRHLSYWRARIWTGTSECYLGHFVDRIDAARAYDRACIALRGWPAAQREGLNLEEENYSAEIEYLENVDFDRLVTSLRSDGVTIEEMSA